MVIFYHTFKQISMFFDEYLRYHIFFCMNSHS
nr:MAG TPA: hypothetical protein [Caudoviricetes sp.]